MSSRRTRLGITVSISLLLLLVLFLPVLARGEVAASSAQQPPRAVNAVSPYAFITTTTTYTEITSGTLHGSGTGIDENSYNAVNIGFTFRFNGVNYTQLGINANGFVRMGGTAFSGTCSYAPISNSDNTNCANVITAQSEDLQGNTGGSLRSELLGEAPNRVFVVQWKDFRHYLASAESYNFQIRLYETSNVVEIVYGPYTKNATNRTDQVGLRGATSADYKNLKTTTATTGSWNSPVNGTSNADTMGLTSTMYPASGLVYRFTPPPPAPDYAASTKTVSPSGTRFSGEVLTYTVAIVNSGDLTGTATTLSDPIPAGTSYVEGTAQVTGGGTLTATASSIDWLGEVAPGARVTVTFQVTLTAQTGSVTNTATISDPAALFTTVKSANTPVQVPNYSTSTKAVFPTGTRYTGETLYYTVTLINSGLMTGTASLSDPVPAGTTYVAGSAAVEGGGVLSDAGDVINWTGTVSASNRITVTYRAVLTAINGSVTNTATISDPLISAAVVKSVSTVVAVPTYSTSTKTASPASGGSINTGEEITYTVTVINSGLVTGTASLADYAPTGTTYVPGSAVVLGGGTLTENNGVEWTGPISVSGRITATFRVTVTALNGVIANTATISDPVTLAAVTKSTSHTVRSPIFSTSTKTASSSAVAAGAALTYTIRIVNSGALSATNATMTDVLPPDFFPNLDGVTATSGSVVTNTWPTIGWSGVVTNGSTIIVTIPGTISPTACSVVIDNSAQIADPLAAPVAVSAQTVVYGPITAWSEGFDDATFPPTGWVTTIVTDVSTTGTPTWSRTTSGSNPTVLPYSGAAMAYFNSFSVGAGDAARLSTPAINLVANTDPVLVFAMYHDTGYSTAPYDRVQVQVSTDGGGSWNNVGAAIDRYSSVNGWVLHGVDLNAYEGQSVNVGFLAISQYGNNMFLDAISVRTCCEPPAGVSFTFDPTSPLTGQPVDFTAAVLTGTAPFTYSWNFGDGSAIGYGNPVTHTYAEAVTYNVTLTVECKCGSTSVSQAVPVSDAPTPPDLDVLLSSTPTAFGTATYFTGTLLSGSAPITYTWDFGDGTVTNDPLATSHTYTATGQYVVSLTADNVAGTDVVSTTVDVGVAPTASFNATPNPTNYPDFTTFTFTGDAGTGPTAYLWTLSNGVTATVDSFTATLTAPAPINNYTATLRVSNPYGTAITDTLVTVLNDSADLAIVKTDSPDPVAGTQPLTYTLVVSNAGPNPVAGAAIGTVSFSNTTAISIPAIGSATPYPSVITVTGVTDLVGKVRVTLSNFAHTYSSDVDVLLVGPHGQSVILMSDVGGSNAATGLTFTFDDEAAQSMPASSALSSGTFKPTNSGTGDTFAAPAPAASYGAALSGFAGVDPNGAWQLFVVDDGSGDQGSFAGGWSLDLSTVQPMTTTVTDNLPAGYTFTGAAGAGWACANNSGVVTCTRGYLPVGSAPAIVINGSAPFLAESGVITNTATISSERPDYNQINNTATITTFVNALRSDLGVLKTDSPDPVGVGETVTYQITVTNNGPDATANVVAVDTLPASFQFASASAGCANAAGTVTCSIGTLNNGQSASVSIVVTATALGTYTNTVSVSAQNPDLVSGNNTATAATTVASPEITVNPVSLSAAQFPSVVTTQTLTIGNAGQVLLNWSVQESPVRPQPIDFSSPAGPQVIERDAHARGKVVTLDRPAPLMPSGPTITLLSEGFESGTMPPSGWLTRTFSTSTRKWSLVDTVLNPTYVYTGTYSGWTNYDSLLSQDEWLLSPQISIPAGNTAAVSFMALSDTEYPGATMTLYAIDASGTFTDTLWDLIADETWTTWSYRQVTRSLNAYQGKTIRLAWRYHGLDGESFGIDSILVTTTSPCEAADLLPWLTASPLSGSTAAGGNSPVSVQFNSTGLTAGVYTGKVCLVSNDATDPVVLVPVTLTVQQPLGVTFVYHDLEDVVQAGETLNIAGTMNGWNANATPLTGDAAGETFSVTLDLAAGNYEYKYIVKSGGDQWDWLNTNNRSRNIAGAGVIDDYRNVVAGYQHIIDPATITGPVGKPTVLITGEVYINNVTNPAGAARGVMAQVGYGQVVTLTNWTWNNMTFTGGQNGNNDIYAGSVTPMATGVFSYAIRFNGNWGAGNPNSTWWYGDLRGVYPGQDFTLAEAGVLTVQNARLFLPLVRK